MHGEIPEVRLQESAPRGVLSSSERQLFRLGSVAIVLGSLLAFIFNAIHPRDFDFDRFTESFLRGAATSTIWIPDHLGLAFAILLLTIGLGAFARSIAGELGSALARLGFVSALVGGAVGLVLMALDGSAAKAAAEAWAGSEGAEKAVAFSSASALVHAALSVLSIFLIVYGVTMAIFGLAIVLGDGYPKWFGWGMLVLGVVSVVPGVLLANDGEFTRGNYGLFVGSSLATSVWVLIAGVLLWRRAQTAS